MLDADGFQGLAELFKLVVETVLQIICLNLQIPAAILNLRVDFCSFERELLSRVLVMLIKLLKRVVEEGRLAAQLLNG